MDSRNKAKEAFVPITQIHEVLSGVADLEKLSKSCPRLSWSINKGKPIPPIGSVEIRVYQFSLI